MSATKKWRPVARLGGSLIGPFGGGCPGCNEASRPTAISRPLAEVVGQAEGAGEIALLPWLDERRVNGSGPALGE